MDARLKRRSNGRHATDARCRIRPVQAVDLGSVASIERLSFSDPWSERDFQECVALDVPLLVADCDGRVVGYVIAHHAADEAEILNLGVDPEERRHGVGRALIHDMLSLLHARGISSVFLEVRESNSVAQGLYASLGFTRVGRRRHYYRRPAEDAVVLRARI